MFEIVEDSPSLEHTYGYDEEKRNRGMAMRHASYRSLFRSVYHVILSKRLIYRKSS